MGDFEYALKSAPPATNRQNLSGLVRDFCEYFLIQIKNVSIADCYRLVKPKLKWGLVLTC